MILKGSKLVKVKIAHKIAKKDIFGKTFIARILARNAQNGTKGAIY